MDVSGGGGTVYMSFCILFVYLELVVARAGIWNLLAGSIL